MGYCVFNLKTLLFSNWKVKLQHCGQTELRRQAGCWKGVHIVKSNSHRYPISPPKSLQQIERLEQLGKMYLVVLSQFLRFAQMSMEVHLRVMRVRLVDFAQASYRFFIFTASYLCSLYSLPCPSVITAHVSIWQSSFELYLIRTLSALLHCATSLPPGFTGAHREQTLREQTTTKQTLSLVFFVLTDISLFFVASSKQRDPLNSKWLVDAFVRQLFPPKRVLSQFQCPSSQSTSDCVMKKSLWKLQ